jgi:hypothetical protein
MEDMSILYKDYTIHYKEAMNYWYTIYDDHCYTNCSLKEIKKIIDKIIIKKIHEETETTEYIGIIYNNTCIGYNEIEEAWYHNNEKDPTYFNSLTECKNDIKSDKVSFIFIINKSDVYNVKNIINYSKSKIVHFFNKDAKCIQKFSYDYIKNTDIIFIKETMPDKQQTILSLVEFKNYLQTEAKQGE